MDASLPVRASFCVVCPPLPQQQRPLGHLGSASSAFDVSKEQVRLGDVLHGRFDIVRYHLLVNPRSFHNVTRQNIGHIAGKRGPSLVRYDSRFSALFLFPL